MKTHLSGIIPPAFFDIYKDIVNSTHTEYWLAGGRGSGKSSFVSIMIILGILRDENANAVCFRRLKRSLRSSLYEQLMWAARVLGVGEYFRGNVSELWIEYLPTGQRIWLLGLEGAFKVRSSRARRGYFKYLWFEEAQELSGMDEVRNVKQTFMRGGEEFVLFYTYNPPRALRHFINVEGKRDVEGRLFHKSCYLDMPKRWLGEPFYVEAEHCREVRPEVYKNEYLGEVTGSGVEVFSNVCLREITDCEISSHCNVRYGIDWGYAVDPFAFCVVEYDVRRRCIYIYDEVYEVGLSNRRAFETISAKLADRSTITADSAEPKSIDEMRGYGLRMRGARKGAGSVEYGLKWLASLESIVIDPVRCPAAANEFVGYELTREIGRTSFRYPDCDNHMIDAVRYALEGDMRSGESGFVRVR